MSASAILDFYSRAAPMTDAGRYAPLLAALPRDVQALARIVQGLVVHERVATDFYRLDLAPARRDESHIRTVARLLERVLALEDAPLAAARAPQKRLIGVCHHFAVLLVALLRAQGFAARARWGFADYLDPDRFDDHVVCEYWSAAQARWVRVDAQLDEAWCTLHRIEFDVFDVPRQRFVAAGDAWMLARSGRADPAQFGADGQRGLWFVAHELAKDVAALAKVEVLPWDTWGGLPRSDRSLDAGRLAFFDRVAGLARDPDRSFAELQSLYESEARLHVPSTVFNVRLQRAQAL
jgi:hypothetical protein